MGRAHDLTGSCEFVLVYMAVGTLAIAALILTLPSYDRRAPEQVSGTQVLVRR